jgi:hypothetical protein
VGGKRRRGWRWQPAWALRIVEIANDGEQNIGANVLREYKALAAFPRLEFVAKEQVESRPGLIEVVVERGEFDGEVVPLFNERCVGFETGQPLGRAWPVRFRSWSYSYRMRASDGATARALAKAWSA